MTTEANKDLVARMEDEFFNRRNLAAIDEFIGEEYVLHTADPSMSSGRDAIRASIASYVSGFPDLRASVDELMAAEDRVAAVITFTGTHDGELFGIPPTHRVIRVRQIAMYRIAGGKVVEEWECSDQLGLMQQLGVVEG
jgi:steroid delta-isomerase-like uncharacterized protein